jgi:hypothetical protein
LSYLPLPPATRYLCASGRGTDYRDASYAPSCRRLWTLLGERPELDARLTLPADISLAEGGGSLVYRVGGAHAAPLPAAAGAVQGGFVVAKEVTVAPYRTATRMSAIVLA